MEHVVLRYRDGRTERASLEPIDASHEVVRVKRDDGDEVEEVPFSQLKAVFFPLTDAAHPRPVTANTNSTVPLRSPTVTPRSTYSPSTW